MRDRGHSAAVPSCLGGGMNRGGRENRGSASVQRLMTRRSRPLPDRSRSMSSHEVTQFTRRTIWAVFVVCAGACGRDATSPSPRDVQVLGAVSAKAKAPTGPGVSSTQPGFGDQGTTLDVHVLGSGFGSDAQATWLLNGVANGHVLTNSTRFVSSSEVV